MTLMEDIRLSINKGWTYVILEIDSFTLVDYKEPPNLMFF